MWVEEWGAATAPSSPYAVRATFDLRVQSIFKLPAAAPCSGTETGCGGGVAGCTVLTAFGLVRIEGEAEVQTYQPITSIRRRQFAVGRFVADLGQLLSG
jgi:hypothetical protein